MAGGVAMTGVAMTDVALTNTGVTLVVIVMMFLTLILEILLFVVCWNLKSKGQNGCCYDGRVGLMVLISVDVISKEGRVGLMVLILVVISKKNIIIDCCVVVLIRCILVLGTSAGGPPRGLSWKTEFGNFLFPDCKG
ncbi:hypothetical protein BD770DRAFT_412145 [Pilaira anomala]|nr:hypothetical protein BD770DRAFT_412145 [Pilaira anomala]